MSDKNEPIPEPRVRKLRKDGSWIRKQDDSTTSKPEAPESKPLVKRNSFVLTAVKRYESFDSSSGSPPPETDSDPLDRDSTNEKVETVKFLHKGVQPKGSSILTQSNAKPKEPTKHLVTPPGEKIKTGNVKTSPSVDSASLPERVSNAKKKQLAASEVQPVNDIAVQKGIKSAPEKATDLRLKQNTDITKPGPLADSDNQIALSEQDEKGIIEDTAVNVETVTNETSVPNTQQPVISGLSEVPAVKANIKITESSEDPAPLPEPSTVIRAERVAVCTPGDKTTAPNSEKSCFQGLSTTPTGKAAIISGESKEKPVALPEPVSALKAKSEVQLRQSVESTPEQLLEHTPKTVVNIKPSLNTDTQTSSEQELNKITTAEVEEGSSPEVPSATVTDEASLPNNMPSDLSGLPKAPFVKADVKSADSQKDPSPFLEPFKVVRAEKVDVFPVKDENTPLPKPVSNNSSQSPAPEALLKLGETKEDSAATQELSSESEVQSIKDVFVEQMIEQTQQCAGDGNWELTRKENLAPLSSADHNNQTFPSEQDANKLAKPAGEIKVESSPEVPSTNKEMKTNETSPSKSMPSVPSGVPEAPAVKVDVKPPESPDNPTPLPEPMTGMRAERATGCVPEDKTTPPNSEQPLSQDLSKTPADKAAITSGKSEEKPVVLPEPVPALKVKSDQKLANDDPAETSIVSTPEQVSENLLKNPVKVESSPNTDTQTSSEQDANKLAKPAGEIKVESSPEVPSSNKEMLTKETSPSKSMPSVPSGVPEAPAVKVDVKPAESPDNPKPLPEPLTVIRAERRTGCVPEDKTTPPNSEQPLSQDLSKTPADKAAMTSGKSEEKPVVLPELVPALKAKSDEQLAKDAPVEPSVVSTPEQVSENLLKNPVKVESPPNTDTQTSSEQDTNKLAKPAGEIKVESSLEVPSTNKEMLTNETSPSKSMPSVPSGVPEAPAVKVDVKPAESPDNPTPLPEPMTRMRAERATGCVPEDKTTPPNGEQPLSQDLSKTPADKAAMTSGKSEEKPVVLPELVPALKAKSDEQLAKDAPVEPSVVSTPEQVSENLLKNPVKVESSPNTDTQTSSEQDTNKLAKPAGEIKVESSPEVPSTNKEMLTNETSPSKSMPSVPSGVPEAPAVKVDVKPAESPDNPTPLPEPLTVIRAEKRTGCVPEDKTTPPNSEQPLSQDLSKTPADKAVITTGKSEEKPVVLPEPVPALKVKSDQQLANDASAETSVVSTPEQVSENLLKNPVKVESSPNTDTQTSSEQDTNKLAKPAGEIKVESSLEVPSTNKEMLTNETSPSKSMPSVPSGVPEAPAVKVDVNPAESPDNPKPLPEPLTVIRAERRTGCVPEDKTTPPNSEQPLSQDLSKTPADKAAITSGKSEEKPVVLPEPVPALKVKSDQQLANDASAETSVVSTPEQVSENLLKNPVKVESSPNTDTQTSSEQDANKLAKPAGEIKVESSLEVPSTNKEMLTNETSPSKSMPSVPSGVPEAPAVKVDVKPAESPDNPKPLPEPLTVIRAERRTGCVPEDKTTPPNSEQPLSQDLSKTPADKAAITSGKSEEKPVVLPEPVPALKVKSDQQLANDAPAETSVVSTPEQVSENLLKNPVKVESSPNTDTQTSSEQDANKLAKPAGEIKVESSPEVPSTNKEMLTNETSPSKSMPSVQSGVPEAPAAKVDVKPAESADDPKPLPEALTVIRAERRTGCVPEDKTTPPNSEQPLSQDLSKTPADKAAITSGKSEEKPVVLPEPVPALKVKSDQQLANDAPAETSVLSTPEQVSENLLKNPVKVESSPNTDTQTSSEQDANKLAKPAGEIKVESSPEVPSTNKEMLTNETSPSKSMPSVQSGVPEAPAAKVDVKPAESADDPKPLPEALTVIRAERQTGCVPEDKTTPPNSEQPLSQDLSKTPADKAVITTGKSEEKPVVLPEPVPALKVKSDQQLANDAPAETSVVSTPEQVSENLLKNPVKVESSPNTDTQTSSEQDANKLAKPAGEIKVESSPEVPSTNKEMLTNETSPSKSMPSVPSGVPEAPAVKVDVKPAESPDNPTPLPEALTVIRAERRTGCVPEDKTTPPNSEQPLSQDLSKTPADKAVITTGKSEEKPVVLPEPVPALKVKSDQQLANDAPAETSVVSTPEQVSENLLKNPVKVESSPNTDTQTSSEQDANKLAKPAGEIKVESSPEVPSTNKEMLTNETSPSKSMPSVPSGVPEAPGVKVDVKPAESPYNPTLLPEPLTVIRAERRTGCVPEDKTTPPNSEQPLSQDLSKTPADKAVITTGKSEEKPVVLPEPVPALKVKSDQQLANDAPAETSVVSTPEQVSENLLKNPVKVESSPNTDTQTSSEQDANKLAKPAGEIKVESSPESPSTNKEMLTNETSPSKSMPSGPSGVPEAPAVKVDVKPAESPDNPTPLPEALTVIRAERRTGCVPEDKTTPPNSEQPLSQDLSKTPADKAAITSGKSEEKPVVLPEPVPALKVKSDQQLANDASAETSVVSTPEQVSENLLKNPVKVESSPNTDTQTSSEQDANKLAKPAGEIKVESSPEVPSSNKEMLTKETSPSKSMPSVPSGVPEAPGVKVDVKPAESPYNPTLLPEPLTVIRAERRTGCVPEDKTTPPNSEQPLSQDLSKTPADKAVITTGKSEEKPVVLPEPVPALKVKSDQQLANDAPAETSVVSTPEQVSENLLKNPVKVESSPNTDTQTSSEQDANKLAKPAGEIKVESSPEVPSTNKEMLTKETSPSKSMPSVPSGVPEAPAVKVDVKPAESPDNPAPLPEALTVIRAERRTGCVPEDRTSPLNSKQLLFKDLSQTPADKAVITSGKSEEKSVVLQEPVPALKAKSDEQLANDSPVEPSVVSTPEQVSENPLKNPVKVESSPNTDTQTSLEQDANKLAKAAAEVVVSHANKETISDEADLPKGDSILGCLSKAPRVKTDVIPTESQEDPVKTLESTGDLNINNMVKPEPSKDTSTSPLKQQIEKVMGEIVQEGELEPIPDTLTLYKATSIHETIPSNIEIPATDSWHKSPHAETLVKAAEHEEDSAAPPEKVPAICAENDVHPLDDATPSNQSDEATYEHAPGQMPALKADKDVQNVTVADNDDLVHKVIELTDVLDVEAPAPESVSKAVDVLEPCLPQDSELKQPHIDSKNSEDLRKIAEDLSSTKNNLRLFSKNDICTYCNQIIDGNAKIVFREPSVICHPECLKCGVCVKDLGSLEITMFLSNETIMCVECYRKT